MMKAFPVQLIVPGDEVPIERTASGRACARTRLWYADWHEQDRGGRKHHAQDIFGPSGSLVLAPEDGVVTRSSASVGPSDKGGHFVYLAVRDDAGRVVRTYYLAHLLGPPSVANGYEVRAGAPLGKLGRSGNAAGKCPHLHIGARRYSRGAAINLFPELVAVDPTKRRPAPKPTASEESC